MTKFNKKQTESQILLNRPDMVLNHEGGVAFAMKAKDELNTRVLSSFHEPKFYENRSEANLGLSQAISKVLDIDPEYVLKLAAYARNEFGLRSLPLILLNEFANSGKFVYGGRKYVPAVVQRADEITELMALSLHTRTTNPEKKFEGKRQSMFIKNGLKKAIGKFDQYQLSKYNRDGEVKLRDVIFITHPKSDTAEQRATYDGIINGTLEPPETWEVYISTHGASKESWEKILPKMGFMAVLRNLNNFVKHDVNIDPVTELLTNPDAVRKSKLYPFRFFSARKALEESKTMENSFKVGKLINAVNVAMELSVENMPTIPGKSLIIVDASYSMTSRVSDKSTVSCADIAGLFGAIASKMCESSDVIAFADEYGRVVLDENMNILDRMNKIRTADVGSATYAHKPMAHARRMKAAYDRIFLFSDMQCYADGYYGESFAKEFILYQREVKPAYLYSIDLTGYGTSQVPSDSQNVCLLAGFSEKIFKFIPLFEMNKSELIKDIEGYRV